MKSSVKDVVCLAVAVRGGYCHHVTNYFRMLHSLFLDLCIVYMVQRGRERICLPDLCPRPPPPTIHLLQNPLQREVTTDNSKFYIHHCTTCNGNMNHKTIFKISNQTGTFNFTEDLRRGSERRRT